MTGRWLVDGSPQVILFDIGSAAWKLDEYKQTLWDTCNIGIPHLDVEANDSVILGYLISEFLSEVSEIFIMYLNKIMMTYIIDVIDITYDYRQILYYCHNTVFAIGISYLIKSIF